jgi:bifunctional DNA-binding transcriptional regulator/antitoxin component of YhaV-PrlF toxin-antitoxin module
MLAKLTANNQITIPKDLLSKFPKVEYFDMEYKDGVILMKPVKVFDADLAVIRKKMQKLGLSEECVAEAVRWARSK